MDAEHAYEQCGGQLGGELEQGGGAGLSGVDAELELVSTSIAAPIHGPETEVVARLFHRGGCDQS